MTERHEILPAARNHGIDALRIVSMMMIVTHHVLGHGGILDSVEKNTIQYAVVWAVEIASFCSVNCYALISGYVGVCSRYKISNLVALWLRVAFYSISITLIVKIINPAAVGKGALICAFIPVISDRYWYFTSYVVLFLLIPLLNIALNQLKKQNLELVLIGVIILFSCVSPFSEIISEDPFVLNRGYSAWWLMVLYLVGGYIRKYGLLSRVKSVFLFLLFCFSTLITWLSKMLIPIFSQYVFGEVRNGDLLLSYTSITVLMSAVFLLLLFERVRLNMIGIKVVAFLSPLAFSVYLIHEQTFMKRFFLENKFIWIAELPAYQAVLVIIGIVLLIYAICSAIDLVRFYLFKALRLKEKLDLLERKLKTKASRKKL